MFINLTPAFIEELGQSKIHESLIATATTQLEGRGATYQALGLRVSSPDMHDFGKCLSYINEDGSLFQLKPENPKMDKNGKVGKYTGPVRTHNSLGIYLPAVPDSLRQHYGVKPGDSFWETIRETEQPIIITEGAKKALSLISAGHLAIALNGCNGSTRTVDGVCELLPALKSFLTGKRKVTIALDQDENPVTRATVALAIDRLVARIAEAGDCDVYVTTWHKSLGKGIDDVHKRAGKAKIDDILDTAKRIVVAPTWLNGQSDDLIYKETKTGAVLKSPNQVAELLMMYLQGKVAFDLKTSNFWHYEAKYPGVWSMVSNVQVQGLVDSALTALSPQGELLSWSDSTLTAIANIIRCRTTDNNIGVPYDSAERDADGNKLPILVAMENGVLNIVSRELLPHDKSYGFTSALPYPYSAVAAFPTRTVETMLASQGGDQKRLTLLRAFMKAMVTGQAAEMQRFLEVIGLGGTGKSTFANLCKALVGVNNVASTTFDKIDGRFEAINFIGKKLILISDAVQYVQSSGLAIIRQLTGGDTIRVEQKNQPMGEGFVNQAMVMITCNEPFKSRESITHGAATAISRRRASALFNVQIDRNDMDHNLLNVGNRAVSGTLASEIPGLLNWVLDLDDLTMREYVLKSEDVCPEMAQAQIDIMIQTNPITQWATQSLIFDPTYKSKIGMGQRTTSQNDDGATVVGFTDSQTKLYPSYLLWCEHSGVKPTTLQRFTQDVMNSLKHDLKHSDIKVTRPQNVATLVGVKLGTPPVVEPEIEPVVEPEIEPVVEPEIETVVPTTVDVAIENDEVFDFEFEFSYEQEDNANLESRLPKSQE